MAVDTSIAEKYALHCLLCASFFYAGRMPCGPLLDFSAAFAGSASAPVASRCHSWIRPAHALAVCVRPASACRVRLGGCALC